MMKVVKIYEDGELIESKIFDSQDRKFEKYLKEVRDRKMNIAARLAGRKNYTDNFLTTKRDRFYPAFTRKATSKYYDIAEQVKENPNFKPLKIVIEPADDLLL
jgi:hypothetical protein